MDTRKDDGDEDIPLIAKASIVVSIVLVLINAYLIARTVFASMDEDYAIFLFEIALARTALGLGLAGSFMKLNHISYSDLGVMLDVLFWVFVTDVVLVFSVPTLQTLGDYWSERSLPPLLGLSSFGVIGLWMHIVMLAYIRISAEVASLYVKRLWD